MNRVHTLSTAELDALETLYRQTSEADIRSRCQMILLSIEGRSPPLIAEQVRFSRRTVTRFIQRYEAEGIQGLMTKPRSGRPPKVTPEYFFRVFLLMLRTVFAAVVFLVFLAIVLSSDVIVSDGENLPYS